MRRSRTAQAVTYVVLGLLAALFLLPFYVMVRNAFSTSTWITSPTWHVLPNSWGTANLGRVLSNANVGLVQALGVSAVIAVTQTVLTVVIAAMAGYALAKLSPTGGGPMGRASSVVLGLTLVTLMVPAAVTFVPSFVMVAGLGWVSSFRGLIVPLLFSGFAVFLFRQFFTGFPVELEEAARLDGAGYWRTFWRVVMPNATGITGAIGTITFIGAWNAFLWPLLIGQDRAYRTVQVALSTFMTSQGVDVPELFTGGLVAIVPVVVVFVVLQRFLVEGVERSGIG
jgi:multiple sugar transport system permease protein